MQKVTSVYKKEAYEVDECLAKVFQLRWTVVSQILNKKESDRHPVATIRCPEQKVFQVSPEVILFMNKTIKSVSIAIAIMVWYG
ncbi:unnamed protein product [Leptosia nina]|uniref:Uncharacterized protein n=1 Tax=Leptosia nina TaxID=320188 RepID=A0AAV1K035_9NEOP